jgi:hypothetical protein
MVGTGAGASTDRSATPRTVRPELLSLADLPSGWSIDSVPQITSHDCMAALGKLHVTARGQVIFAYRHSLPELAEQLVYSTSAHKGFADVTNRLDSCTEFTESAHGRTYHGTLTTMSFGQFGSRSAAFDAKVTVNTVPIEEGFVVVQKDDYLLAVSVGYFGSLDSSLLRQMTMAALSKLNN